MSAASVRRRLTFGVAAVAAFLSLAGCALTSGTANAAPAPTPALTEGMEHTATAAQVFGNGIYNDPNSEAARAAAALTASHDAARAAAARTLAAYPTATWLGDWFTPAQAAQKVDTITAAAKKLGQTAVFVTYAIPERDCGNLSAGGLTPSAYQTWNGVIASHLRGTRSVVLIEPDSLSLLTSCPAAADARYPLLKEAVHQFADAGVAAYLDGGNCNWNSADLQAHRLRSAWIAGARGFYTNVSNFYPTANERAYAEKVSALTGGAHYIIDTSRNGQGWKGTWCNPVGAGLGLPPKVITGDPHLDALLWVKTPGESDGACNGAPVAGAWWPAYAEALITHRAK
ncbi:glycoside hydrolase family 6 protein [Curtobacterium sp. MCBD17_040]|uniref:glycoside hydrolase family 6 protein n=1 Tax=Curtobacterium sp. MCBD17_040 TaxID=2175674 RepID=UPI000DAA008D|nr:glycoside hydrolase family 6 protein [Curtobacterium sp. MCBD17_040]WIB65453.1 glycoside hydrolase family 6 protein [Curtobacterium sp. MCBD17_040]